MAHSILNTTMIELDKARAKIVELQAELERLNQGVAETNRLLHLRPRCRIMDPSQEISELRQELCDTMPDPDKFAIERGWMSKPRDLDEEHGEDLFNRSFENPTKGKS